MPKFKPFNYNQTSMVVINFEEQLQADTFEHALHYLIDNKLDLSVFYPSDLKKSCMKNPDSPNTRKGHGRQVSFTVKNKPSYTDWMKERVDSDKGKYIYSHRMSVVEPGLPI